MSLKNSCKLPFCHDDICPHRVRRHCDSFLMYSIPQRFSALFALLVSLGLALLVCISVSSYFLNFVPGHIHVDFYQLNIAKTTDGYNRKFYRTTDTATMKLSIQADFKPLFHWNVKEIFAYLVLEYESVDYKRNEIVIWDRIITQSDSHIINIDNMNSKYPIVDIADNLPETKGVLKLKWNTVPWTGVLFDTSQHGEKIIKFPSVAANQPGNR